MSKFVEFDAGAEEQMVLSSTQWRILQAATQAFAQYSIRNTTMEDVARISGLSRQTIYRNYRNKEELVATVSEFKSKAITEAVRKRLPDAPDSRSRIEIAILTCVEYLVNDPQTREMLDGDHKALVVRAARPRIIAGVRDRWMPILEDAIADGTVRTGLDIDSLIFWLTDLELLLAIRVLAFEVTVEAVWCEVEEFVMDGVCVRNA